MNQVVYAYRVWVAEYPAFTATYRMTKPVTSEILRKMLGIPNEIALKSKVDNRMKNGGKELVG